MPRSRSSPHASSGSSHSYRSSQSSPAHPPQPTSNSRSSASKDHPQVTNVYLQRGGGAGLMGTLAASAGGAMIGHSLSNYLYGGNTAAPTQVAEAQTLAKEANAEGYVCAPQLNGYSLCLENNNNSPDQCKWAWDYFLQCQKNHTSPQ